MIVLLIILQNPENKWVVLLLALFLASIAEFIYSRFAKRKARKLLETSSLQADSASVPSRELSKKNVIISGGFSPFIGAGFDLDSWSFTVDLSEPDDKYKPIAKITVTDLQDYIRERLCSLNIDEMIITDQLFVNGQDVNLAAHLLPNGRLAKPIENIDEEYILKKMNSNDKKERHYRVVRIPMWNGQLFLSMYYRFLVTNDILFCEARFFLLTPLKKKYLEIKNIPLMPTKREFFEALMQSIFVGAFSWIQVWLNALAFMQGGFMSERARVKQWQREVESNRLYNYGWENSLREKWSSELYERYFQKVDKDVSQKLLTNGFLAGLMDFLSERNICIDQFKQTSSKIINEGVMISGGEVRAETLAVGKGAKIAHTAINTVRGGEKQS